MQENYRHCEAFVRAADKDRYLATLFARADKREPLFALYAFNQDIGSIRDRAREPMPGEIRLQWWRDVLDGERADEAAANPVAAALLDTLGRFHLPVAPLLNLIEAHAFDLYGDPMPTFAALEGYARRTEATIFEMVSRIIVGDHAGALAPAAQHAGIANTLASLLGAFARHASRGQIYIPVDLLERHGVRLEGVLAGETTAELREVLADLRGEARRYFTGFEAMLAQLPAASAPAFLPLEVLDRHDARVEDILAGHTTRELREALANLRTAAHRHFAAFEAMVQQLSAASVPAFLPLALIPGYLAVMDRPDYDPFRSFAEVPQWRRQWALWRAAHRWARLMRG